MPRTFTTRPYSKVVRDMWGDDRFVRLSPVKPSGQDLWVYLLTGPHVTVIPGVIVSMGFGTLADRLKWSVSDVKKHWAEIETLKMASADWHAGVIWLPNSFRHNEPANPNVVKSWRNVPLPQCDLVRRALVRLRQQLWPLEVARIQKLRGDDKDPSKSLGWLQAFDSVFAKAFPEAIVGGYPEELPADAMRQGFLEGLGEPLLESLGEGLGGRVPPNGSVNGYANGRGSTGTGTGTGSEDLNTPLTPRSRGGQVSLRRPSAEERDYAESIRTTHRGCPHTDNPCESRQECVGRLVYLKRHNELAGMVVEAHA